MASMDGDDIVEVYVAVGRFVVDRWAAEELSRTMGEPLDEQAAWDRWDECSERHLRNLRTEAIDALNDRTHAIGLPNYLAGWARQVEPVRGFAKIAAWTLTEAFRGFVGAIGILIFGLLLVWLAPHVVQSIRTTVNDSLPDRTRPLH